jgi:predicted enzyme related to lactoylglutathione lyase
MHDAFGRLVPELPVADVTSTQQFYRDKLGFHIDWIWDNDFGAVTNGHTQIFFSKSENPFSDCTLYIFVENADTLYDACTTAGVEIVTPIESVPWGMREFVIRDINGHKLRIGHGEKTLGEIERFHITDSVE